MICLLVKQDNGSPKEGTSAATAESAEEEEKASLSCRGECKLQHDHFSFQEHVE